MSFLSRRIVLLLLTVFCCRQEAAAQSRPMEFGRDIYSLLHKACFECHGPKKQEGELRLDQRQSLFDSGTVVPGEPENSELLRRISLPKDHDEIMPVIGEPLSKREVNTIRRWIRQGAVWPESFEAGRHWSYIPPVRPIAPDINSGEGIDSDWARNDIDRFVAARLHAEGLKPSAEASAATLVRRLFLDLIGLPPTPAEVGHFVASPTEQAYEKLVNDLLARPQFGEHWARHWLDLARYADSHGFQRDNLRDVWAYRDWVIQAMNADMPFDRFTIEQIAGDLLPNATESQRIATGFHRCTPTNVEAGSLPEETRVEQVIDRVNTTGAVWLGTTLECCQCHDHKYDPFSAKDYYGLLAFFNSTEMEADRTNPNTPSSIQFKGPKMELSSAEKETQRAELKQQQVALQKQLDARTDELMKSLPEWAADLAVSAADIPQTHVLKIVEFRSQGKTDSHRILENGAVLLVGNEPPDKDVYEVTVRTSLSDITAFRLDVLTHDSLPGNGPGRGDAKKTNFVLTRFSAKLKELSDSIPLKFTSAVADFSQKSWDVNGALKDKPRTGWAIAPQFGKPHWAQFRLSEPLDASDQKLTFRLEHDYGAARSIGCFQISAVTGRLSADSVPPEIAAIALLPPEKWTKPDRQKLVTFRSARDSTAGKLAAQIDKLKKQQQALVADTTLVMIELDEPRMSYVFDRGDYRSKGETIAAATPAILHPLPEGPSNRLTLAKWLVDPANPLVARVTVNRWWAQMFGRGLVPTLEDFGVKGDEPSHPELLDWLAVGLMENGWSMKQLLRTIVLSSTYRQSSFVSPELEERDDVNRLLARGPRFRMDAEMIRDNALAVSGLLDLKQFGPSIRPYQPDGIWSKVGGESYKYVVSPGSEQYRRGLYVVLKRGAPYPSFMNFDATARLTCTVQRSRTNTPLQALTLLNDPVYVEAAQALARRVLSERHQTDVAEQVAFAFQLCTARLPSNDEVNILVDLLETQRSVSLASADSQPPGNLPEGVSTADFRAWQSVATTLLNLHETITKN